MSDVYAINVAKTDFREGFNTGDVEQVMSVFGSEGFSDMSEGEASKYGIEALDTFRSRVQNLFAGYIVKLTPIVINIVVMGDTAYDYGWHEFAHTPKSGGDVIWKRQRYFELWKKNAGGEWKIAMYFTNSDVREELNGFASRWFLNAESSAQAPA